jgi:cytochrome c oxidase subunit 4
MSKPLKFFLIWVALMLLLALTVGVAQLHLGLPGTALGMVIASLKAALVMAVFMHLEEDSAMVRLLAGAAFAWLLLLFGFTLCDYFSRG